jgi:hypothetical protein
VTLRGAFSGEQGITVITLKTLSGRHSDGAALSGNISHNTKRGATVITLILMTARDANVVTGVLAL